MDRKTNIILLTGGIGFIGFHTAKKLLEKGKSIVCIDSFDAYYARDIKEANLTALKKYPNFEFIEGDIRNIEALNVSPVDSIVHLAALAGVRPSIESPLAYQSVNVQGTHNILEFARIKNIKKIIFASSSSVYGVNPRTPWSEDDAVLQPISPYAATKVAGELLGYTYSHLFGIQFLALRFFTVYGPGQRPDLAIHKFTKRITSGEPIYIFGDGSTRRDYTYIDDIVAGIVGALEYEKSQYEIINLGNNITISLSEMIDMIENKLGLTAKKEYVSEQPGDVPITFANIEKAQRLLGYSPSTSFEQGIENFIQWYNAIKG